MIAYFVGGYILARALHRWISAHSSEDGRPGKELGHGFFQVVM